MSEAPKVKFRAMITEEAAAVDVSREPNHVLRFENNLIRAYWIDLAPGAATQFHTHNHPYAGVCVSDCVFRNEIVGSSDTECHLRTGEVIYTPGNMTHRIENFGPNAFQNLTVEVLHGAGHTTSSLKRLERERRQVQVAVDERALRVGILELSAGERCDLIGDHLVIWLAGETSTSTFAERRQLRRAGDFAWCCGVATLESVDGAKIAIVEIV